MLVFLVFQFPTPNFLMFPQLLPLLACLERSSSPDCALADSAATSSKLPTRSCFHLLEPPVSQSCPGHQRSDRFCLLLARNLLSLSLCCMSALVMPNMQGWVCTLSVLACAMAFVPQGIWETTSTSDEMFHSHGDRSQPDVVLKSSSPRAR